MQYMYACLYVHHACARGAVVVAGCAVSNTCAHRLAGIALDPILSFDGHGLPAGLLALLALALLGRLLARSLGLRLCPLPLLPLRDAREHALDERAHVCTAGRARGS